MASRSSSVSVVLFSFLVLAACSDSSEDGSAASSGGPSPLVSQLSACPSVQTSSDPAASACLAGTFAGKTLAGEACSLTVRADGGFDFAAPALTFTFAPKADSIRVFSHAETQGSHMVGWRIGDPISTETMRELKFDARFGNYVEAKDAKIDIEASENNDGAKKTSSCVVTL